MRRWDQFAPPTVTAPLGSSHWKAAVVTHRHRHSLMRGSELARGWLCEARPLDRAAAEAGFADWGHLARTFQAALEMTPGRHLEPCATRGSDGGALLATELRHQRRREVRFRP